MNSVKAELAGVKTEVRKLPLQTHDMVRKEHKYIGKSIIDLSVALLDTACNRDQISVP